MNEVFGIAYGLLATVGGLASFVFYRASRTSTKKSTELYIKTRESKIITSVTLVKSGFVMREGREHSLKCENSVDHICKCHCGGKYHGIHTGVKATKVLTV